MLLLGGKKKTEKFGLGRVGSDSASNQSTLYHSFVDYFSRAAHSDVFYCLLDTNQYESIVYNRYAVMHYLLWVISRIREFSLSGQMTLVQLFQCWQAAVCCGLDSSATVL